MMDRLRGLLDRLVRVLPGVLMTVFALGSWWLVRSLPSLFSEAQPKLVRLAPDYYLENFSVKSFDSQGRLSRELSGSRAQHFPDSDTLEVNQVKLRALSLEGRLVNASADKALAKGDGTQMTLLGDVKLTQQVGPSGKNKGALFEMSGQSLNAFPKDERLVSDLPIEIRRGTDVFSANSMQLNAKTGAYELSGKVRGLIQATRH
jgi:lipopolysaccharide export system protein LptC